MLKLIEDAKLASQSYIKGIFAVNFFIAFSYPFLFSSCKICKRECAQEDMERFEKYMRRERRRKAEGGGGVHILAFSNNLYISRTMQFFSVF